LAEIAKEHNNAEIDLIALDWILKHPVNAILISGTFKTDRNKDAVDSPYIDLTEEQWYQILIASHGHPMA
jgi:predicted oxidoreductase